MPKKKPELKCCSSCGRDTAAKSAICCRCQSYDDGEPPKESPSDERFADYFEDDLMILTPDDIALWNGEDCAVKKWEEIVKSGLKKPRKRKKKRSS